MIHYGTIKKWNLDRGFGFVEPVDEGPDIFVHIQEFPNKSVCPQIGEKITFTIKTDPDGKKRAVQIVRISGIQSPQPQSIRRGPMQITNKSSAFSFKATIISTLTVIFIVAGFIYFHKVKEGVKSIPITKKTTPELMAIMDPVAVEKGVEAPRSVVAAKPVVAPTPVAQRFSCDGRTHCSQMTSCDEAIFFLKNCPNTQMDGDGDGIPCEKQWCR